MSQPWSQSARLFVLVLVILAAILLVYAMRPLIGPLVIAALLAYVLNPLVDLAQRRARLPRGLVVPSLYVISLVVLVVLVITLTPVLAQQAQTISVELQEIGATLEQSLSREIVIFDFVVIPDEIVAIPNLSQQFIRSDRLLVMLETASTNFVWILVILVVSYYLLLDWDRLREWLFRLVPPSRDIDVRRLYDEIRLIWRNYLRGQLVLMAIMGVLTGVGMAAIGLPGAAAIGVLTGFLDVVPTLGPTFALIIAAIVAWLEGSTYLPLSDFWFTLLVVAVHTGIQVLENVYLRPRVMGRRMQIHPVVVFVGIIAALSTIGVLGALIVVPLLGTAAVVGSYLRARILALEPWPQPEDDSS